VRHLLIETHKDIDTMISKIRSGKSGRDEAIEKLYYDEVLRKKISIVLNRYGGQKTDFDDIFNVSLMQFVKTVVKNKDMVITTSLHAYICGIAKFVWMNKSKKENKIRVEDIDDQYDIQSDTTPESLLLDQTKIEQLDGLLQKLGKNCKEVLMHWANGYSMKEIAEMMNYKSDNMAKKKKYKCFKELLEYLEANPDIKKALR